MRRLLMLVHLAVCAAGCGDPENGQLAQGQAAILVMGSADRVLLPEGPGKKCFVAAGTRGTVVSDPGYGQSDELKRDRHVLIHINEGELAGETCKAWRWSLRPID